MRNVSLPRRDFSPAGVSRWFYRSSENEWVCSFIQKVMETRTQRETMPGCISVKQVNMTFSAAYLLIKTTSMCYQETWHLAEFTQWWRDYRCFLVVSSSCFRQLQLDVVPPDPERCGWRAEGGWSFSPDDSSPPARRQLELRGPPGAADADGKRVRRRLEDELSITALLWAGIYLLKCCTLKLKCKCLKIMLMLLNTSFTNIFLLFFFYQIKQKQKLATNVSDVDLHLIGFKSWW